MTNITTNGSAVSQLPTVAEVIGNVSNAHTSKELQEILTSINKQSTDLVNSDVVSSGYLIHGHPKELAFQHLATMTTSRLKKRFVNFTRKDKFMNTLWHIVHLIVAEEIYNKYKFRNEGTPYEYAKVINSRVEDLFTKAAELYKVKEIE